MGPGYKTQKEKKSSLFDLNRFHISLLTDTLGPVVQSVVSLTSLLRVISLTVLEDSIYNILIFLLKKISAYLRIAWCKF